MDGEADVVWFYEDGYDESARLAGGSGLLELLRTQQIVGRYLDGEALRIADVGGGPGVYAEWLARLGHHVVLVDPVERHIAHARLRTPPAGSITALLGDARRLDLSDGTTDIVLLLGPLYHLPEPRDRQQALSEAMRVLRPRGHLLAGAVSRFTSFHDGLVHGLLRDPEFAEVARADLATGRHENPDGRPDWFTRAYFHRPGELAAEIGAAGFGEVDVFGVEGLAGWLPDLEERLGRAEERALILDYLARVEHEPSLLGVGAHLLAHATKPG